MKTLALNAITYKDYTGGYNDTVSPYNISTNELRVIENCNIKKTVGGLPMRKGTDKINTDSLNGNITRRIEYFLRLISRKVFIKDKKMYFDGDPTELLTVDIDKPHFIQRSDVLYVSDNTDIYEYGQKDYFSNVGTVDIVTGDIVQVASTHSNPLIRGNFYKAKSNLGLTDLTIEDYTVIADWEDVTDINDVISNVIRPVKAFDPSRVEVFTIVITNPCTLTGSLDITVDGNKTTIAVTNGDTVNAVATKINSGVYANYTTSVNQNMVTFTAASAGYREDPIFQPYSTGVGGFTDVIVNGVTNDNAIDEVRKCNRVILHSKSLRYVASGNPDNPTAIYFSEPGQIGYWKDTNILVPTSSDGEVRAMFNLANSVIVSYNRSWWEYSGVDPETDGTWKQLPIPFGCESEWTIKILSSYNFIYLAKDGLYVVSANILNQEGVPTQNTDALINVTNGKVDNTINSIIDKTQCTAEFVDDVYFMAYNDNPEGTINNKILCYYSDMRSFTKYTGLYVNDFLLNSNGILEIASKNYNILTESDNYFDIDVETGDPIPIIPVIESAELTFGAIENPKFFEKAFIHFVQTMDDDTALVNINVTVGGSVQDFEDVDIAPSLIWGRNWGSIWGFEPLYYYAAFLRRKGVWIRYKITSSSVGSPIEFYGVTFEYKQMRKQATAFLGSPI